MMITKHGITAIQSGRSVLVKDELGKVIVHITLGSKRQLKTRELENILTEVQHRFKKGG